MTATQTPCTSPEADRFAGTTKTPDPPLAHPARKRYWEDTVFEAVGELRHRLASSRESVVTLALLAIIDVEKTRMRHGRPLSGTQASHARDDDGSLPKLGPLEVDTPIPPKRREGEAPAKPSATHGDQPIADGPPATVSPTRERGPLAVADQPAAVDTPQPDGPRSRVGLTAPLAPTPPNTPPPSPSTGDADRRRFEQMRDGYIESYGRYPEDDFPNNPDYHRFRDEPRPHPAFLRYLCWKYGTGDDSLPLGTEDATPGTVPAVPLAPWRPTADNSG